MDAKVENKEEKTCECNECNCEEECKCDEECTCEKEPKKEMPLAEDLPKMDPMQGQSITDLQKQLTDQMQEHLKKPVRKGQSLDL